MTENETNALPEWPKTEPDAATLLRYHAGRGLWLSAAIWLAIERDDSNLSDRLMYQMMAAHDTYFTLTALHECDPVRADEVAARLWSAAEAGDSYGEWLWQWAEEKGLDVEAISSDARKAIEQHEPKAGETAGETA